MAKLSRSDTWETEGTGSSFLDKGTKTRLMAGIPFVQMVDLEIESTPTAEGRCTAKGHCLQLLLHSCLSAACGCLQFMLVTVAVPTLFPERQK